MASEITIQDVTVSNLKKYEELHDTSNYELLGYEIDVEAQNTINKADKIVCTPNSEYVTPTFSATGIQSGIVSMSKDESVVIAVPTTPGQTLTKNSQITVYFRNDETGEYGDGYDITFDDFPSEMTSNLYNTFVMNEDGTLAYSAWYTNVNSATSFVNVCIVLEIDKENKTVAYSYKTFSFDNQPAGGSGSSASYVCRIDSPSLYGGTFSGSYPGTYGVAYGDYIITRAIAHVYNPDTSAYIQNNSILCVFKYDRTSKTFSLEYNTLPLNQSSVIANNAMYGNCAYRDGEIMFAISTYLLKYNIANNTLNIGGNTGISKILFSKNGSYVATASGTSTATINVYSVSWEDLTLTAFKSHTISVGNGTKYVGYASDDGIYVWENTGHLHDMINDTYYDDGVGGSTLYSPSTFISNRHAMVTNASGVGPYLCYKMALTPGTEAQYLASKTTSTDCSTADRVYGVASQNLVVGQRGKARALFVTPAEE